MHILVTTDGSEHSLDALDAAHQFGAAARASITLTRVLDPYVDCGDEFAPSLEQAVARTAGRWEADLNDTLRQSRIEGNAVVIRKRRGEATARAILRAAQEEKADVIAMATRGSGRVRRALLGSVAMEVLSRATLPVLVTGKRFRRPDTVAGSPYHVVVTTDGSPGSLAAMREVAALLASPGIRLTLLRICWPGDADPADEDEMRSVARSVPGEQVPAVEVREMAMIEGAPKAVLAVASELGASAIAMATHGHSGAYHVFAGSVALAVVDRAEVPVILARSRGG